MTLGCLGNDEAAAAAGRFGVVPVLVWRNEENQNGDYVKLDDAKLEGGYCEVHVGLPVVCPPSSSCSSSSSSSSSSPSSSNGSTSCGSRWWSIWWWAKLILLGAFVGVLVAVFFKWIGPFFMDKVSDTFFKKNYLNHRFLNFYKKSEVCCSFLRCILVLDFMYFFVCTCFFFCKFLCRGFISAF